MGLLFGAPSTFDPILLQLHRHVITCRLTFDGSSPSPPSRDISRPICLWLHIPVRLSEPSFNYYFRTTLLGFILICFFNFFKLYISAMSATLYLRWLMITGCYYYIFSRHETELRLNPRRMLLKAFLLFVGYFLFKLQYCLIQDVAFVASCYTLLKCVLSYLLRLLYFRKLRAPLRVFQPVRQGGGVWQATRSNKDVDVDVWW